MGSCTCQNRGLIQIRSVPTLITFTFTCWRDKCFNYS